MKGRPKKYYTKEQQSQAKKERQQRYYLRNREDIIGKNLQRYYDNKDDIDISATVP